MMTVRQYFYRMSACKALGARAADCICWHDEGTGPLAYTPQSELPKLRWRTKPEMKVVRVCNACNWKGHTDRMLGSIGPLCPECGETTEVEWVPGEADAREAHYVDRIDDLAHSVYEEAMAFGMSVDLLKKYFKGLIDLPLRMILHCPVCRRQHVDAPEPDKGWTNPPHKSHLCGFCGCQWRPADVPTTGVAHTETKGKNDNWPTKPWE